MDLLQKPTSTMESALQQYKLTGHSLGRYMKGRQMTTFLKV